MYTIDKLSSAVIHLEAATFLMLNEDSPEAVHTLISAARTVLWDLGKTQKNDLIVKFEEATERMVKPGRMKDWNFYKNRAANFFKHADRDPEEQLSGINFNSLNDMELLICVLVVGRFVKTLSPRLTIALALTGFRAGGWFDFKSYAASVNAEFPYDHYAIMSESERVALFLKAFSLHDGTSSTTMSR